MGEPVDDNATDRESGFPIRVIAELTGVPAATLRAWERRYGLLKPRRTAKGHRLYDNEDLETVRRVTRLLDRNHTISKAVRLVVDGGTEEAEPSKAESPWATLRKRFLRAVEAFDDNRLDALYTEALSVYPVDVVTVNLLRPLLEELGERWHSRERGIAEEHFFSAYLRNKVGARMHHAPGSTRGRRLLMACLPAEQHELGILLFALSVMARGYRVLYLGPDLPLSQVRAVAEMADPAGVLLSGSAPEFADGLRSGLAVLARSLTVPLMVGGNVSGTDPEGWLELGITPLGADYGTALERLGGLVPAFGPR